jgi:hypothetical protein
MGCSRAPGKVSAASCRSLRRCGSRLGRGAAGDGWLHEIKYDGYRMHSRIDGGAQRNLDLASSVRILSELG